MEQHRDTSIPGPASHGGASCPMPIELAAWIDGRLDDGPREAVETHLGSCPSCVAAVAQVVAALDARSTVEVTASVVEDAKRLVQPMPTLGTSDRGWWRTAPALGRWAGWVTAAAATITVCVLGYQAGTVAPGGSGGDLALVEAMSFGVVAADGIEGGELELLVLAIEDADPATLGRGVNR